MAIMSTNMIGLIFANLHDSTIPDLTKMRTMGSVPYGARFRLIDFPLSNMVNSGITSVGVITKGNYQSLLDHLGSGDEWDLSRKTGGLQILPPYGNDRRRGLYRGRMEALQSVKRYIESNNAEYVLMSDCNVIVNMDYNHILEYHIEKGADITIVYGHGNYNATQMLTKTAFGVDSDGRINDVLINPEKEGAFNTSMNMYIVGREFLLDLITETASRNLYDFDVDVVQHKHNEFKIYGYRYNGYYEQIDGILSFFSANMALMNYDRRKVLFPRRRPIYTKVRDDAPAKYGLESEVNNSLVADGCVIEGKVENCVLFRGAKVGKGAIINNCILMQDTIIGDKCELNYVISDKNVNVGGYRSLFGTADYPVFVAKGSNV
ncbi:MAG: glucose-1-phosphate adenylyltransferase subunit GlgD [Oscillospiraceae bacterium]|nr:glucose-1-phosphate adenylyltransferase subunit GlgD [Oscillospiraceae bacterium]